MSFRIYHTPLGGHVHCRLFAGSFLSHCGDFVMRQDEFAVFSDEAQHVIDFVPPVGCKASSGCDVIALEDL